MVLWIILGVLLLFFGFFAYKSTEIWNPAHIALASGIFVMSLVFVVLASASLKTRTTWMKKYEDLSQQLETENARTVALTEGTPFDQASRDTSIVGLKEELNRIVELRGQVWRNLIQLERSDQGFVLNTASWGEDAYRNLGRTESPTDAPAEGDAAAPAAVAKPHGIQAQMILHAFGEVPLKMEGVPEAIQAAIHSLLGNAGLLEKDTQGLFRVPLVYLGEFRVVQVEAGQVVLSPTLPLTEMQTAGVANFRFWTLYDSMPQDSHDVFAGATAEQLTALFSFLQLPPPIVPPLVAEYTRDGQDAQATDSPYRSWFEVKFVKPYQIEVDVPADGEMRLPEAPFDVSGRARDPNLRHGGEGPLTIDPAGVQGLTTVLDPFTGQQSVNAGIVELVRRVFIRQLRDYGYLFRDAHAQLHTAQDSYRVRQRNLEIINSGLETLAKQIEYRTGEREHLQEDLKQFGRETAVLQNYVQQLEMRIDELRESLKSLYLAVVRQAAGIGQ